MTYRTSRRPRWQTAILAIATVGMLAAAGFTYHATRMLPKTLKGPLPGLVLPGDYPDPSVTRAGGVYWATATSSEWAPLFPLLTSTNLQEWRLRGYVFPDGPPAWASSNFWAPEIDYDSTDGRTYIYYTARHREKNVLCVACASADKPEGPYRDHGPLVCQDVGSIDGEPVRDKDGKLYLIWKEDGNSVQQPTYFYLQEINEARTQLVGERKQLFRNEAPWEGGLVEGPSVIRQGDWFYLFYAANACCGRACNYAQGVARARDLSGPWEKNPNNPVLRPDSTWTCPGHGTVIKDTTGKWQFLYHAYSRTGNVMVGRQGVLAPVWFGTDGWPTIKPQTTAPQEAPQPGTIAITRFRDEFDTPVILPSWQWTVQQKPNIQQAKGALQLQPIVGPVGAFTGQMLRTPRMVAETALPPGSNGGSLAAIGDTANAIGIGRFGNQVQLWQTKAGKRTVLAEADVAGNKQLFLQLVVDGTRMQASWANTQNGSWNKLGEPVDGGYLPPWDRGIRMGLVASTLNGKTPKPATFEWFDLQPMPDPVRF